MRFLHAILPRAAETGLEAEIQEELQTHLDETRDALISSGLDPSEAEERALARFGNYDTTLHHCMAERRQGSEPMKATLIALVVLLAGGLLFTVARSRRILAQEAAAADAEVSRLSAVFKQTRANKEPRPVIYSVGDILTISDLDGLLIAEDRLVATSVCVAEDGMGLFPKLGWIEVHGKQREQLEGELQNRYEEIFTDLTQVIVQKK